MSPATPLSIFDALKTGKTIYTLNYMAKYKPQTGQIVARDFNEAKQFGDAYCKKYNLKYLSVIPFFLDLTSAPIPRISQSEEPLSTNQTSLNLEHSEA